MARTAIPLVKLTRNTVALAGTLAAPVGGGIAIDQANGHIVTPKRVSKMVLVVYIAGAGPYTLTAKAGVYPPAEGMGLGDYVTAGLVTVTFSFLTLDASRHIQKDGSVWIDTQVGCTGVIWAYEMPA